MVYVAGMALSFLTDTFDWRIRLLSVRHFYPGPGMKKDAATTVPYIRDGLKEVGLQLSNHLHAATTDGGGEIRKACTQLFPRETDDEEDNDDDEELDNLGEKDEEATEDSASQQQEEADDDDIEVEDDDYGVASSTWVALDDPVSRYTGAHTHGR
jgi:hypothetical protein